VQRMLYICAAGLCTSMVAALPRADLWSRLLTEPADSLEIPVNDASGRPDRAHVPHPGTGNVARWQHGGQCRCRRDPALLEVLRSGQDSTEVRQQKQVYWLWPAAGCTEQAEIETNAGLISRSERYAFDARLSLLLHFICFFGILLWFARKLTCCCSL